MTAARLPTDRGCLAALLVAVALSGVVTTAEAAGVYKWVDAKGSTHYDDKNIFSSRVTQAGLDRRMVAAHPFNTPPAVFAARVRQLCALGHERLGNYRQARELYGQDPAGNVYRMSVTQIGITIAETERDNEQLCATDAASRLYAQRVAALTQPYPDRSVRQ